MRRSSCEIKYLRKSLISKNNPIYCSKKCEKIGKILRREKSQKARYKLRLAIKPSYRAELLETLGNECVICGTTQKIVLHEIHGRKHPNLSMTPKAVFLKEGFEFTPVCRTCHTILSLLAKRHYSESQLEKLLAKVAQIQK